METLFRELANLDSIVESNSRLYYRSLRKAVESRKANPILADAIAGKKTVEESYTELSGSYWQRILPRHFDAKFNQQISQLGDLVNEPLGLRTTNIFSLPNNVFSAFI